MKPHSSITLRASLIVSRIGRVQEEHRGRGAGVEALLAHAPQQVAHRHRDVAEVDVHRARLLALVADGAVIGDVGELVQVADRDAAARLLLVQERLDQQRGREDLVARRIEQVGARHVRRADRLALAAAQAVLDRIRDRVDVGLLHDQRLVPEQVEARRVGVAQVAAGQQLAAVEAALRIDALLVVAELGGLGVGQELELGDADAVLAGDHAVEVARDLHDAHDGAVRLLQHLVVVGVDRDVRVHVAVAGVHVQRDPHAAAQHALVDLLDGLQHRRERAAGEQPAQVRAHFRLPRRADRAVLQQVEHAHARLALDAPLEVAAQRLEAQRCELRQRLAQRRIEMLARDTPSARACRRAPAAPGPADRRAAPRATRARDPDRRPCRAAARRRSTPAARRSSCSLFSNDSSMLMRSIASV